VEKVLLPAIEPLAAMLKSAGWTCDIERTPHGFKVAAFRVRIWWSMGQESAALASRSSSKKEKSLVTEATPSGRSLGFEDIRGQR